MGRSGKRKVKEDVQHWSPYKCREEWMVVVGEVCLGLCKCPSERKRQEMRFWEKFGYCVKSFGNERRLVIELDQSPRILSLYV